MSNYDEYWIKSLARVRALLEQAATQQAACADFSDIKPYAPRGRQDSSWRGKVHVRNQMITKSDSSAAHLQSLARVVSNHMLCCKYPDRDFAFRMSPDRTLIVELLSKWSTVKPSPFENGYCTEDSQRPEAPADDGRRNNDPAAVPHTPSLDRPNLDLPHLCATIHACLTCLPLLTSPHEVTFKNGVYFHYEDEEASSHGPSGRIVRVGTHDVEGRLVARLELHYTKSASVFRRHLSGAMLCRDAELSCAQHWHSSDMQPCHQGGSRQNAVTDYLLSHTRFRCVLVPDVKECNLLEKRLIATLGACPICRPSSTWLGLHARNRRIQRSGLWNVEGIGGPNCDCGLLQRFAILVSQTPGFRGPIPRLT